MKKELQKGDVVAERYEVDSLIGSGGVGDVYLVKDRELGGRPVALKVLSSAFVRDATMYKRFQDEVSLTRDLSHPNIIRIYDIGRDADNVVFLSMEYIEGRSLARLIRDFGETALPFNDVVWILSEICQGLQLAHKKGVIHRDLKPENILITTEGELRLVDFGLARWRSAKRRTAIGETVGTPLYMAPEQFRGKDVDGRCDIYALGLLAFEIVTGSPPYSDSNLDKLAKMHANTPLPNVRDKRADLPVWYQHFIRKCSAKRTQDRFQSCLEAIEYLEEHHQLETSDSRNNVELKERVTTIKKSVQEIRANQHRKSSDKSTRNQIKPKPIPQEFHRRHLKISKKPESSRFARYMTLAFILTMAWIIIKGVSQ